MLKKILLGTAAVAAAAAGAACAAVIKNKQKKMPLIGEKAPSFIAHTTRGAINFPEDYQGSWVVLFSHPADFTPVCTTEFMTFQNSKSKFDEIGAALIGLSVDSLESHRDWLDAIKEKIDFKGMKNVDVTFPLIDDENKKIARKYGMLHENSSTTKTVRAVFVIDPDGIIRAILYYPQSTGRNISEIFRLVNALMVSDDYEVATPANWIPGDDVIVPPDKRAYQMSDEEKKEYKITCHDWFLCTKPLNK